jgi:DNA-binding response OmpR family regulator
MTRHILVVEDDLAIAQTLLFALRLLPDVAVARAANAEEALTQLAQQSADIILTDHHMQGMSGVELVRELRGQGMTVPIMLITAYDTIQLQREARDAGITEIVPKPFQIDQLLEQVGALLPQTQIAAQ